MKCWLGIDFETTGLDVQNDLIIEVGAVLWDVQRRLPVVQFGALIKTEVSISKDITSITGITNEDVAKFGIPFERAAIELEFMAKDASHLVAHNGTNFDMPLYFASLNRIGKATPRMPWIDTSVDIDFPAHISTRKLSHLAAEHGFINPFQHRAVSDVLTMLKIASFYDFNQIESWSISPSVKLAARVSYDNRSQASARGYRWDAAAKSWVKTIKECQLKRETENSPFEFDVIAAGGGNGS